MSDPLLGELRRLGDALQQAVVAVPFSERSNGVATHRGPVIPSPTRRRVRAAVVVLGAVAAFVGVAVTRPHAPGGEDAAGNPAASVVSAARVGAWMEGAPLPFQMSNVLLAEPTTDGRVVVLTGGSKDERPSAGIEGGVYDSESDKWASIPLAPLGGDATFQMAGEAIVAMSTDAGSRGAVALLDLRTLAWQVVALPDSTDGADRSSWDMSTWAWDGTTLVLVRTGPTLARPSDSMVWTLRWDRASGSWSDGAPFPLLPRSLHSDVVGKGRLSVIAGYTDDAAAAGSELVAIDQQPVLQDDVDQQSIELTRVFRDAATYDIAGDSWSMLPQLPAGVTFQTGAAGVWRDDVLSLVAGYSGVGVPRLTVELRNGKWSVLNSPSADGFLNSSPAELLVVDTAAASGPQPVEYLDPTTNRWAMAPHRTLVEAASGLVALSATPDNPGDGPFEGAVLRDGVWYAVSEAPFRNRMVPGVVAIGDLVMVIAGDEGPQLTPTSDLWILDLA